MVKILPEGAFLPPLQTARSILIIKLDALGDCILLSPFLKNLRSNCPQAKITIVAAKASASLLDFCSAVDERIYLPGNWHQAQETADQTVQKIRNAGPYDLAIVPRWEADYYGAGFLAQASGARIRVSYAASCLNRKLTANPDADQPYTHVIEDTENRHEIERNLLLLTSLGLNAKDDALTIWAAPDDDDKALQFLARHNLTSKEFIAIAPGASLPQKVWPLERWQAFAARWHETENRPLVIVGAGDSDQNYAVSLQDQNVISAVNHFNPRETAALLKHTGFFVGADSFAKHAAATFNVPIVEISCHPQDGDPHGEYHNSRFGAWQTQSIYVQPATCDGRDTCVDNVRLDQVWNAVQAIKA